MVRIKSSKSFSKEFHYLPDYLKQMTSIKEHCCGADLLFDEKTANKQYKRYLKKGPSRITKRIIAQLEEVEKGDVLIDVGGGIGAIQWWFLNKGGKKSIDVDASSGYLALAEKHAQKFGLEESTEFIMGDFTDHAEKLPYADHITLDKVICCYPDYQSILSLATQKSRKSISLSYPMDGPIANIFRSIGVLVLKIKGNPFKPYVHKVDAVRRFLNDSGFSLKERGLSFPWHVETYVKNN